jgi:hypothetical protein
MTYSNIMSSPLYFDNTETINHSFPSSMVLEHLNESVVVYLERCESQQLFKKSLFNGLILFLYLLYQ